MPSTIRRSAWSIGSGHGPNGLRARALEIILRHEWSATFTGVEVLEARDRGMDARKRQRIPTTADTDPRLPDLAANGLVHHVATNQAPGTNKIHVLGFLRQDPPARLPIAANSHIAPEVGRQRALKRPVPDADRGNPRIAKEATQFVP